MLDAAFEILEYVNKYVVVDCKFYLFFGFGLSLTERYLLHMINSRAFTIRNGSKIMIKQDFLALFLDW